MAQADPQQTTEFVLGQISAKLDDVHAMVHRQDEKFAECVRELHAKDKEQEAHIVSLISWRARVRGMFAIIVALPTVGILIAKLLGVPL